MSTSLVVTEMVTDAQELFDGSVDDLTAFLEDVATLGSTEVPAPSAELALLLAGSPAPAPTPARRPSRHAQARRRGALAGLAAAAVTGMSLTGAAAVANELPVPVQRVVAHLSEQYLPFTFPRPLGDPPAPDTAPTRAPDQTPSHASAPNHGDRVGGRSWGAGSPDSTGLPGGLSPHPLLPEGSQGGRPAVPPPSVTGGTHALKGASVEGAPGAGQGTVPGDTAAQPQVTDPGVAPGGLPTDAPVGTPSGAPAGTPSGAPGETPAGSPAGTPSGTPNDTGAGTGTGGSTGAPDAGGGGSSSAGTGALPGSGQSSGPTSSPDPGTGPSVTGPSVTGPSVTGPSVTGPSGSGTETGAHTATTDKGAGNAHRGHGRGGFHRIGKRGMTHGVMADHTPTAGPDVESPTGTPTPTEQDTASDGTGW